jgi:hypothetical protein
MCLPTLSAVSLTLFWLRCLTGKTALWNRCIQSTAGQCLKGFPDAINAAFPETTVQAGAPPVQG